MGPETFQTADLVLQFINTVGVMGLLILASVLLYRGDLMSKQVVTQMLEEARLQVREVADAVLKGLEDRLVQAVEKATQDAVKDALRDAPKTQRRSGGSF